MTWTDAHAGALGAAFAALDAAGIDWLVLRNHQGLPQANRSKDVDIGLDKADFSRAKNAIALALKAIGFEKLLVQDFQYVRCLTFFSVDGPVPLSIKIDLLDGFVFRGAQLFHFRELLANARREGGFVIPSTIDDAAMLWIKPLLTGGIVKPKYLPEIRRAAEEDPKGFKAVLDRILTRKWSALAWSRIENDDVPGTIALKSGLRRSCWLRAFHRHRLATLRDAGSHVLFEFARRSRRPPAGFFVVLGPDGVGKTTFIASLRSRLATLQVKDVEDIEVGHFRPHILPNINQLLTGKVETIGAFNDPHSAPPAGRLSSFLRILYYSLDYIFGYALKLRCRLVGGRTMIFDRYFYDFIVDPRRSRLSLPSWVPKFLLLLIPKPDLVFVLDTDPAEIYSRKTELQPDEIERQLADYRKLVDGDPARFLRVDAGQPPEAMVDTAVREMVTRLYRKS